MKNIVAIILAAGEGRRMKSSMPKVLHPICGKPMIQYTIDNLKQIGLQKIVVVVGHKSDLVREQVKGVEFVLQDRLLGTGDAVLRAKKLISQYKNVDSLFIACGDVPLITSETLRKIIARHLASRSGCTLLTAHMKNPTGYGRIVSSGDEKITKIVEELDASIYEKVIEEINVGLYCFNKDVLFDALEKIKPDNRKSEYYLTDTIEIIAKSNKLVDSVSTNNAEEFLGVNTRGDLIKVEEILKSRLMDNIMKRGVTIIDPANTYIEDGIEIAKDTVIYPYTFIEKGVKIGARCNIGPFARLRVGTVVAPDVAIGNFVEIVRSKIGSHTRIHHQCYIGDTTIGKNVNIGAGTIVANYDGKKKNKTVIDDNAFIGTGTILVAPVNVGKGAVTGSGAVVTKNKNVPAGGTVVGIPARPIKKKAGRKER